MNNLVPISKLIYDHDGGYFNIIGTRKWYLEAYDEHNTLICKLNQDNNDNNNYITYVKFIKLLRNNGYKLRDSDIIEITENTMQKNFLLEYFLKYAQKTHIYEIGEINNYSKSFLLKEIDPLLCLVFLKSSAILFIKQIDSATFLSICFALF